MNDIKTYNPSSLNFANFFQSALYKMAFLRDNPNYFQPDGIWVYCGAQGSGKTLSAVRSLFRILHDYPLARVYSNIPIVGLDREYIEFTDYSQLSDSNGINGIVYFLDEIHVLWNSLESKNIPISEMSIFCQMRKDRRVIIGTSQVYSRIAKPIREQLKYVVDCRNFFGLLQCNTLIDPTTAIEKDGHVSGDVLGRSYFFHAPSDYKRYDTLNKVVRANRFGGRFYG